MNNKYIYQFEGSSGMQDMRYIMKMFRCGFRTIGNAEVKSVTELSKAADGTAGTEALEYRLAGGYSFIIRSSAFEPKIEVTVSVPDSSGDHAAETGKRICEDLENIIYIDNRLGYCCE